LVTILVLIGNAEFRGNKKESGDALIVRLKVKRNKPKEKS